MPFRGKILGGIAQVVGQHVLHAEDPELAPDVLNRVGVCDALLGKVEVLLPGRAQQPARERALGSNQSRLGVVDFET